MFKGTISYQTGTNLLATGWRSTIVKEVTTKLGEGNTISEKYKMEIIPWRININRVEELYKGVLQRKEVKKKCQIMGFKSNKEVWGYDDGNFYWKE